MANNAKKDASNENSKGFFGLLKEAFTDTLKSELSKINDSGVDVKEKTDRILDLFEQAKTSGADLAAREEMLANELDRALRKKISYICLIFISVFTVASYVIMIFNYTVPWNIPDKLMIALIVETPIQFIGILYIIARNLFPTPK